MASNVFKAGLLGFIGGFAGGKAEDIELQERQAQAEALRLRKEESAILKERRLLKLRSDFAGTANVEQLTADQILNPDGSFNLPADLDPSIAATVNVSNVRDVLKQYRAERRIISKEERGFTTVAPGATVLSNVEKARLVREGEGQFTAPAAPPTRAELSRDLESIIRNSDSKLNALAPKFGKTERKVLRELSFSDIQEDADSSEAFSSLTQDMARANVLAAVRERIKVSPSDVALLNSDALVQQIEAQQKVIAGAIAAGVQDFTDAILTAKERNPSLNRRTGVSVARQLISRGYTDAEGKQVNTKQLLSELNMWNDTVSNIMFESMIAALR